jgi:cytochrome c-type biogenesis protein CcmE
MKTGAIVTAVVATVAFAGVLVAFSSNASPYVTIEQAKHSSGDRLHLAGTVDQTSISHDVRARTLRFKLTDDTGTKVQVVHQGDMPPNLSEVKFVVAVGKMEGGDFRSNQLIVKCPSKYEADKSSGANKPAGSK